MPKFNNTRTTLPHLRHRKAATARPPEDFAFLNSDAWRKLSKVHRRQHPLCECCKAAGRVPIPPSRHTDHIIERAAGGAELAWENLMSVCIPCHSTKTRMEAAGHLCDVVKREDGKLIPAPGGKEVVMGKINMHK